MPPSPENHNQSLWNAITTRPTFPSLSSNLSTDICIIGAGITGLTTAYLLAKAGRKVIVIDSDNIGAGDTSYTTAHITDALDLRYFQLQQLHGLEYARQSLQDHQNAIQKIQSIIAEEGIDCDFSRVDGFLFLGPEDQSKTLQKETETLHQLGQDKSAIVDAKIANIQLGKALLFPAQAQFHPLKYLAGLAKAILSMGGQIYQKSPAENILENTAGVQVILKNKLTIDCQSAVIATYWPLNKNFPAPIQQKIYQTYVIALKVPRDTYAPALYWDTAEPYHYIRSYSSPDLDHDFLIVGGEDHPIGHGADAQKKFKNLSDWTREKLSQSAEIAYQWSGLVPEPQDGNAFIGLSPNHKNIYTSSGYSGNGLTYSVIAALANSSLILGATSQKALP